MKTCDYQKITVSTSKEYDILIGKGLLSKVGQLINGIISLCKVAIITDDLVSPLYLQTVSNALKEQGFEVVSFVFKNGEESKNINTYAQILNFLSKEQLTRSDLIVALGGGVVGDMAGFVSATYLRGVKYVQVPTTLLAQIDSSVGGKTAIDLQNGKNLVGAFYQPSLVICDVDVLNSLPNQVLVDGLGEAVKYALLDKSVFEVLSAKNFDICKLVYLCVDYKRKIVESDEFESGDRKLLNLGHTVGHAIEKLSNYKISHGKAVAMGIKVMVNASFKRGYINHNQYEEILSVIERFIGKAEHGFNLKDICDSTMVDKKREGDFITLVMVYGVGDVRLEKIKTAELWGYLS